MKKLTNEEIADTKKACYDNQLRLGMLIDGKMQENILRLIAEVKEAREKAICDSCIHTYLQRRNAVPYHFEPRHATTSQKGGKNDTEV